MERKFSFSDALSNAFSIGFKNILSLIGAVLLWILTFWIPYINVGTTIALITIPASLSRGEIISPTEIFNKKYLKNMGDFFLVMALSYVGIFAAMLFFIIPGIVLSLAWSLGILLVVDKGLNANEALNLSNKLTYGYKWIMFGAQVVLVLPLCIFSLLSPSISLALSSIYYLIVLIPVSLGLTAYIYGQLASDVEAK